jgi:predicted  nucleic acid-binding Zn-ribbon protein
MEGDMDTHKHQCPACGTVWEHGDNCSFVGLDSTFEQAHSCPECGTFQNVKYFGPADPDHVGECVLGSEERYENHAVVDRLGIAEDVWTA